MSKHSFLHIGIIESSPIICEGIENLILKSGIHAHITFINSIEDISTEHLKQEFNIIIVNPVLIQNCETHFKTIQKQTEHISWIALIYSYVNPEIVKLFSDTISIYDDTPSIINKIGSQIPEAKEKNSISFTVREIEIIKEMIRGGSNKEIANTLHISVHTVMSHRKNIIQKTGIKSQAALTIYALSQNIISIQDI